MAWKQFLNDFDDFDFKKLVEMVDVFWDDREKIAETANMVWENRERLLKAVDYVSEYQDHITDVVGFINENREKLGDLMERLPELLSHTGEGIETAGLSAVRASTLLTGKAAAGSRAKAAKGDDQIISAYEMTGMAALALERCNLQLEHVAALIQELGDKVDDIRIPSFNPRYTEVMGFNVMTGIDLEETALTDNMADRMRNGADRLSEISDDFSNVSVQFRKLGAMLVHTGDNLSSVGEQLQSSGRTLRRVGGRTPDRAATIQLTAQLEAGEQSIPQASALEEEIKRLQAQAGDVRSTRTGGKPSVQGTDRRPPAKKPAKPATKTKRTTAAKPASPKEKKSGR